MICWRGDTLPGRSSYLSLMDHLQALREFAASFRAAQAAGDIDPLERDAIIGELYVLLSDLEVGDA